MVDHMASQSEPVATLLGAVGEAPPAVPKKPSEVLGAAADLIEPGGQWTQGSWARDVAGSDDVDISNAACWCILGATWQVVGGIAGPGADDAEVYLRRAIGLERDLGVGSWNDDPERTQAEAVAALRQAADLARAEGQ